MISQSPLTVGSGSFQKHTSKARSYSKSIEAKISFFVFSWRINNLSETKIYSRFSLFFITTSHLSYVYPLPDLLNQEES